MEAPRENYREEYRPIFGSEITDRPLFGTSNRKDRFINLMLGFTTVLIFMVTLISSFVAHTPPRGLNIFFVFCILMMSIGHVVIIYWYRQGDLHPKFRVLIYYNAITVILLSSCALSFFFADK